MPTEPCARCGGPLGRSARVYCSRLCANGRHSSAVPRTPRPCDICGELYKPGRSDTLQRTCSRACGVELRRRENGTAGRTPGRWPSRSIWFRECGHCGSLFTARRAKQTACSPDCSRRLSWAKSNAARYVTERACACGAVISPSRSKCDDCLARSKAEARRRKRRAERARHHGAKHEPYTLTEIAQRDRYRCGLCGKRVAMTKAVPHPRAPTIDHVLPLACGGDDLRANVQLAHFSCNARKCTGGSQQLAMFG